LSDDVSDPQPDIERAARAALDGRLVVLPTETVYGIGTRPDLPEATAALFEAKHRPRELELPVLVADLAAAAPIGQLGADGSRLVEQFWPGPLTIVVPRTEVSRDWDLGGGRSTIGLRAPAHPLAHALLVRTGPLAVTSANRSGTPTPPTCEEVRRVFGDAVSVYLCDDAGQGVSSSTVIDLSEGRPRVLRAGPIGEDELLAALVD
jgi:tRNA threonylcarbamoyl adenosine modification protein (Sua5/YciO/YrdC/YwlC family)